MRLRFTIRDLLWLTALVAMGVGRSRFALAHYNFCRAARHLRMTPAMAANVTGTLWG